MTRLPSFLVLATTLPLVLAVSNTLPPVTIVKEAQDLLDRTMRHNPRARTFPSCVFDPSPAEINVEGILQDVIPRLVANELNGDSFNATKSVKFRFTSAPGSLESSMDAHAASWARPLVDSWSAGVGANIFLLNALSVPCGSHVAAHYDDTVTPKHTPLRVSVLYLSLPRTFLAGGELHVYQSRAHAASGGAPTCTVAPAAGSAIHFRGDMFHGITGLECENPDPGDERISIVLEQYDLSDLALSFPVTVDDRTVDFVFEDMGGDVTTENRNARLTEAASLFVRLQGIEHRDEATWLLVERMNGMLSVRDEVEAAKQHQDPGNRLSTPLHKSSIDYPSDLINVEVKTSSLPGQEQLGVFTRRDIAANTLLCEHRGHYVGSVDEAGELWDRTVHTRHGVLVEEGLCSIINDCRQVTLNETFVEVQDKCWSSYEINAEMRLEEKSGKPFVLTTRPLKAGEEIFYDYGAGYWTEWAAKKA